MIISQNSSSRQRLRSISRLLCLSQSMLSRAGLNNLSITLMRYLSIQTQYKSQKAQLSSYGKLRAKMMMKVYNNCPNFFSWCCTRYLKAPREGLFSPQMSSKLEQLISWQLSVLSLQTVQCAISKRMLKLWAVMICGLPPRWVKRNCLMMTSNWYSMRGYFYCLVRMVSRSISMLAILKSSSYIFSIRAASSPSYLSTCSKIQRILLIIEGMSVSLMGFSFVKAVNTSNYPISFQMKPFSFQSPLEHKERSYSPFMARLLMAQSTISTICLAWLCVKMRQPFWAEQKSYTPVTYPKSCTRMGCKFSIASEQQETQLAITHSMRMYVRGFFLKRDIFFISSRAVSLRVSGSSKRKQRWSDWSEREQMKMSLVDDYSYFQLPSRSPSSTLMKDSRAFVRLMFLSRWQSSEREASISSRITASLSSICCRLMSLRNWLFFWRGSREWRAGVGVRQNIIYVAPRRYGVYDKVGTGRRSSPSRVAQWYRVGLITQRSEDRNLSLLYFYTGTPRHQIKIGKRRRHHCCSLLGMESSLFFLLMKWSSLVCFTWFQSSTLLALFEILD